MKKKVRNIALIAVGGILLVLWIWNVIDTSRSKMMSELLNLNDYDGAVLDIMKNEEGMAYLLRLTDPEDKKWFLDRFGQLKMMMSYQDQNVYNDWYIGLYSENKVSFQTFVDTGRVSVSGLYYMPESMFDLQVLLLETFEHFKDKVGEAEILEEDEYY